MTTPHDELDNAIIQIKRRHGRDTMTAGEIAPHLPDHLISPFWDRCIDRVIAEVEAELDGDQ